MKTIMLALLFCFAIGVAFAGTPVLAAEDTTGYVADSTRAGQLAEHLVLRSGGRKAWANAKAIHVESVVRPGAAGKLPYFLEFWFSFARPQTLTRLRNQSMNRLWSINGEEGWIVKESENGPVLSPLSPHRQAVEMKVWSGAFARNIWRIASNDRTLAVKSSAADRLELFTAGKGMTAWVEFDAAGDVARFGFPEDMDNGTRLTGYAAFGPYRFPIAGNSDDGSVAFDTVTANVLESDAPAGFFAPPGDLSRLERVWQ